MSATLTKSYRATFILDTRGYEDPVENLVEKLSGIIKELGGEVSETENHGRRDFARVTDAKHTGDSYVIFHFSGPLSLPAELHEKLRLDKTVKRLLVEGL